jgi:hypothetical protein
MRCDLLGKTLRQGKIVFQIKDEFYNGGKVSVEEAINMIENSTIVNMVGKNCVDKAVMKGYYILRLSWKSMVCPRSNSEALASPSIMSITTRPEQATS